MTRSSFLAALMATGFITSIDFSDPAQVVVNFDPTIPASKFVSAGFDLTILTDLGQVLTLCSVRSSFPIQISRRTPLATTSGSYGVIHAKCRFGSVTRRLEADSRYPATPRVLKPTRSGRHSRRRRFFGLPSALLRLFDKRLAEA